MPELNPNKCIVCDYLKIGPERLDPRPLCSLCGGPVFPQLLSSLDQEMTQEVADAPLLDCANNDLFRFLSDLGEIGSSHPHLQATRDLVGTLIMNIQGQNRVDYYSLQRGIPPQRLLNIIFYLQEIGLVNIITDPVGKNRHRIREVTTPEGSIIQKAFISMEASGGWEEHREPNLVLAFIIVRGLDRAVNTILQTGTLNFGEGITRLYVSNGKVYIPRQFTAPLTFILGSWANARDEFTEDEIIPFMELRGLNPRERDKIVRTIGGVNPGMQHTLYRMERYSYGGYTQTYRFLLNPRFVALRERIRSRMRARSGP